MKSKLAMILACGVLTAIAPVARAQATLDDSIPPGTNFDKAQFRFWAPKGIDKLRAVLVLVPGSNGDGRNMAEDTVWQAYAAKNKLAIVACRFTDKPHDQNFIEDYVNVSHGSGQALVDVINKFASRGHHPEIANAPIFLWGMSAGGQFDYEFAAWKPERVAAFVVNKGGIYYTALTSRATREVPALLFIGGKDLESRVETITGLFALNRRGGALWALTEEPGLAHVVGRSRDLAMIFFDEIIAQRLGDNGALKPLSEKSGTIGDIHSHELQPMPAKAPVNPTAWLPSEKVARAWQAVVTDKPFER
jgi:poly(3-hydroxybutyrate) depolymerase